MWAADRSEQWMILIPLAALILVILGGLGGPANFLAELDLALRQLFHDCRTWLAALLT